MKKSMLKNINKQSGAVLVLSLLMLFVLTLIGVSSINTTTMEEKMSGNSRNQQLAFHAAEIAIREAEIFLTITSNPPALFTATSGANGLYTLSKGPSNYNATDKGWWANSANGRKTYGVKPKLTTPTYDLASAPQYTIEYRGVSKQKEATDPTLSGGESVNEGQGGIAIFRITARGTGLTDNAVVVIQSHFGKRI